MGGKVASNASTEAISSQQSAAMAEYLANGRPAEYDERTWLDMLIVKHTLIAAEKMKIEGDSISGMTDGESSSSYVRWDNDDNA